MSLCLALATVPGCSASFDTDNLPGGDASSGSTPGSSADSGTSTPGSDGGGGGGNDGGGGGGNDGGGGNSDAGGGDDDGGDDDGTPDAGEECGGSAGAECCPPMNADSCGDEWLECSGTTCRACGREDEPCCAEGPQCDTSLLPLLTCLIGNVCGLPIL